MTPNTAGARDWRPELRRLTEECCDKPRTEGHAGRHWARAECSACMADALAAAYEAGRADAMTGTLLGIPSQPPMEKACHCGKTLTVECNCCHAPAGEPCRHKRSEP